jgi:hypothetical protein
MCSFYDTPAQWTTPCCQWAAGEKGLCHLLFSAGLRTLVVARADLKRRRFARWLARYRRATTDLAQVV